MPPAPIPGSDGSPFGPAPRPSEGARGSYGYPGYGYPDYGYGPPGSNRINVKKLTNEVLQVVRRGKWIIPVVFVLVMGLVIAYLMLSSPTYQAYTLISIDGGRASNTEYALSFGFVDGNDLAAQDGSTQALLLQESILIAESAARQLIDMQTLPGTRTPLPILEESTRPSLLSRLLGKDETGPVTTADLALALQERYVRIRTEGRGDVIRVGAESSHPAEAQLIAGLYAAEYVDRTMEASLERIVASRRFLEEQVAKTKGELDLLEEQTKSYVRDRGVVSLDGSTQYSVGQLAELEAQTAEARMELSGLEASLESMEAEFEVLRPNLASGVASGVEQEIQQIQERITELELIVEQIYIRNPDLRRDPSGNQNLQDLLSQITQQRRRVQELSEQYVEEFLSVGGAALTTGRDALNYAAELKRRIEDRRSEIRSIQARVRALEQRTTEYEGNLRSVPEQTIGLEELRRNRDAVERRYMHMLDNLEQVRMAEESEIGVARIMRPAVLPEAPVGPGKAFMLVLGAMLGLMLGFLGAVIRHSMDSRLYTPDDVRARNLDVLGVIPDMQQTVTAPANGHPQKRGNPSLSEIHVAVGSIEVSSTFVSLLDPMSVTADAYRRLYVNVHYGRSDPPLHSVLVTSAEAEVGKSTTAANLALSAARAGKRTLLLDADLYRPTIYKRLGLNAEHRIDIATMLQRPSLNASLLRVEEIDNFYVLGTPKPLENAVELVGSPEMAGLLERLKAQFDLIVVDSPPLLLATGSRMLSRACEATILVVGAGTTDGDAVEHVVGELYEAGVTVLGAVLNRFDPSGEPGYKYTYGYRQKHYSKYYSPA